REYRLRPAHRFGGWCFDALHETRRAGTFELIFTMVLQGMADIINLRQARKHKQRAERAQQAAENRAKHGRTKGEKQRDAADADRVRRTVDHAKLTDEE